MTNTWKYRDSRQKLSIFVSSKIEECKEERVAASTAIKSINHTPVIFEALGARPYPPRDLYLSRLKDSQAMVAIYKTGYGYIDEASGMTISGLEDEYRFARNQSIDTLIYISRDASGREAALTSFIDEIKPDSSLYFFNDVEALEEQIREDLTTLITEKVLKALRNSDVVAESAVVVLTQVEKAVGVVLDRGSLVNEILNLSSSGKVVCISGQGGIGKTTLAAQVAAATNATFVRLSGISPRDAFSVCAEAMAGLDGRQALMVNTLESARLSLAATWASKSSFTLVVDECDHLTQLIDAIELGGGVSADKQLIVTSRDVLPSAINFEVPPLTMTEANKLAGEGRWAEPVLQSTYRGNPMLLQLGLMKGEAGITARVAELNSPAVEMLNYVALSDVPLTAEQLIELRNDTSYSISALSSDLERAGDLLDESPRGFRLVNPEIGRLVTEKTKQHSQLFQFYINRLVRLFEDGEQFRTAYRTSEKLGNGSEIRLREDAIREAVQHGDWRIGVELIEKTLKDALDVESRSTALYLMLSLIYPLELMGELERAEILLAQAKTLAAHLGDIHVSRVLEAELSSRVRRAVNAKDVESLVSIYERYKSQEDRFNVGRVGLELSALYLSVKKYALAIPILRESREAFQEIANEHGVDLVERNLVSVLLEIPGGEVEAEDLISAIKSRGENESDGRRERAWMCNILTRRLRSAGRHAEAAEFAKEAMTIADLLGDEALRAINLVNLGNSYRDQKLPDEAIATYTEAAKAAIKCGRKDIEADASRLTAGVYNDSEEFESKHERSEKAKFFAQHAINLLPGTFYHRALAHAYWELGVAQRAAGKSDLASGAMFKSAGEFRLDGQEEDCISALRNAVHESLPAHVDAYLTGMGEYLGCEAIDRQAFSFDLLLELFDPIVLKCPKACLIEILGNHLSFAWEKLDVPLRNRARADSC